MNRRAVYGIPELCRLADVGRWRLLSILRTNGITPRRSGRRLFVTLYQLRNAFPELYYSLAADKAGR